MDWMKDYQDRLRQRAVEIQERAQQLAVPQSLTDQIRNWWEHLPDTKRKEHYNMRELVKEFEKAPALIGESLHELGWQRKRRWTGEGGYVRFWVPPRQHNELE